MVHSEMYYNIAKLHVYEILTMHISVDANFIIYIFFQSASQ
jgi:hypothetical protein